MSSSASTRPTATNKNPYDLVPPRGQCAVTGRPIAPGERFMAALVETPEGFSRLDCSMEGWESFDRSAAVAYWQTAMPQGPTQKKSLFVDDQTLCDLFRRLSDVEEPAKLNFRFVLGLILMRKRLLSYESSRKEDGREVWRVRLKGDDAELDLVDPKLSEEQVREVSGQLDQVLSEAA